MGRFVKVKRSPLAKIIEPFSNRPKRILGPCKSCRIATGLFNSKAVCLINRILR